MPSEPAITRFFGINVSQSLENLTIKKSDLIAPTGLSPSYEFTPSEFNRSEQLATALLLKWQRNQDVSADSQLYLSQFEQQLIFRFGKWQRQYTMTIDIYVDDNANNLPNPNLL